MNWQCDATFKKEYYHNKNRVFFFHSLCESLFFSFKDYYSACALVLCVRESGVAYQKLTFEIITMTANRCVCAADVFGRTQIGLPDIPKFLSDISVSSDMIYI
jgi:hypothetical protein